MKKQWIAFLLVLVFMTGLLSGCGAQPPVGQTQEETPSETPEDAAGGVTRAEWLAMLAECFGFDTYRSEEPYYGDVDAGSELFPAVQSMAEWSVLAVYDQDALEPDRAVTWEEVASTAALAGGYMPAGGDIDIADTVRYAREHGIVSPDETMTDPVMPEACQAALEAARAAYLAPPEEEVISHVFNEELADLSGIPAGDVLVQDGSLSFPPAYVQDVAWDDTGSVAAVTVSTDAGQFLLSPGSTFITAPTEESPAGTAYKITEIAEENGEIVFITQTPTLEDIYDELVIHTTVTVGGDNIAWDDGVTASPLSASANGQGERYHVELLSARRAPEEEPEEEETNYGFHEAMHFEMGDKTLTPRVSTNSWAVEQSEAGLVLAGSNFFYPATPDISDFIDGKVWEKALQKEDKYETGWELTGDISFDMIVTIDVEYHKVLGVPTQLESAVMTIYTDIASDWKLEGKISFPVTLAKICIPIGPTGVTVDGSLILYIDASGAAQIRFETENINRTEWNHAAGLRNMAAKSDTEEDVTATIDMSGGVGLTAKVRVFSVFNLLQAELKAGLEVETAGSIVGRCEDLTVNDSTTRDYTESIKLSSTLYAPIITFTVKGPDILKDSFGLEKTWDIIGKDKALTVSLLDEEWEIWHAVAVIGPDDEILDVEILTGAPAPEEDVPAMDVLPEPTEPAENERMMTEGALEQYRAVISRASSYQYDPYGYASPTGYYRYALVQMHPDDSDPTLLLEQECDDYMMYARVFQYDPDSGTVREPEGVLTEGAASLGGYRGGFGMQIDGNGMQTMETMAMTGETTVYRITVDGDSLSWVTQWEGRIDMMPPGIDYIDIQWYDVTDMAGFIAWGADENALSAAGDTGTALPEDGGRIVFRGTANTYSYDQVIALQGQPDPNAQWADASQTFHIIVLDAPQSMEINTASGDGLYRGEVRLIDVTYAGLSAEYDGQSLIFSIDPYGTYWPSDTSLPLGHPRTEDVHVLNG